MPAVSVVVICFNDAQHLGTAVRSATTQTLRDLEVVIVDDGSDDETPTVAAALAAADERVRYHRLETNSGGCSRPRNVGMSLVTGDYVTFLDSDDALPRPACSRLLRAARRTDADIVCGRWVRRHHRPTRYIEAHRRLYARAAVVDGIAERPEQLFDTPAPAKLYRRRFLTDNDLSFPEGLLYEDLLFTTAAYVSARRIAVVPDLVYVWNVRRDADIPSITNRTELRNWQDRFEVHRRIDAHLARVDVPAAVVRAKQVKFLSADFTVFLRDLRGRRTDDRQALLDLAQKYLTGIDERSWPVEPVGPRVAAVLAARGDLPGVLAAADFAVTGGLASDLTVEGGDRLRWTSAHPDAGDALDVTATGVLSAAFAATPFLATVDHARWEGDSLFCDGRVYDVLGRLGPAQSLAGRILVRGRLGGVLWSGPLLLTDAGADVRFSGRLDLVALGKALGRPTVGHELRLLVELQRDGERVVRPLTGRDADLPPGDHPLPTPWRRLVGDRVRIAEVNGRLVLQLTALPQITDRAIAAGSWARYAAQQTAARLHRP
ncbi:MAG TPA: glycosyltransferase family 2 protein [Mycobacteriales bacterium]|nr:glycosyltransferase family 2 protein [Mycobacteriales bacterium]